MAVETDRVEKLLTRIDAAWAGFRESYAGLPDDLLLEPGVMGDWSIKDIFAHVTTWEEEALKHLPLIMTGGRPPRYVTYGGIDAFNARMTEQKRRLSLADIRRQMDDTHQRLREFIQSAPPDQFMSETRARRRLRLDTYGHYAEHTRGIRSWRDVRTAV
jgi:DinB family protein